MIASIALTPKYALSLGLMLSRGTLATNAYHARIQCHEDAVRADGGLRRRLAMAAAAATASGGDRQRQWDGGGYVTRRLVARKRERPLCVRMLTIMNNMIKIVETITGTRVQQRVCTIGAMTNRPNTGQPQPTLAESKPNRLSCEYV